MYAGVRQPIGVYTIISGASGPIFGGFLAHLPQTSGSLGAWRAVFLGGVYTNQVLRIYGADG